MTKNEMIDRITEQHPEVTKKAVGEIVAATIAEISSGLRREKRVWLAGFGTFTVRTRKARMGINPQTKKPIKIAASRFVGFKSGPELKRGL